MYTPPRKYLDLIRHGRHGKDCLCGNVKGILVYEGEYLPGTKGKECQYTPALALRLTQVLVQQGYDDARIRREHMKPMNAGFFWVRRQTDPYAASQSLLDQCDRTRKPYIPMKQRHALILKFVRTGEVWTQKALIRAVGHTNDGDVRKDILLLEQAHAVRVDRISHGTSKFAVWLQISIATSAERFWDMSLEIRRELARRIARLKAIAKGCRRISGGKAQDVVMPMSRDIDLEIDRENNDALAAFWLDVLGPVQKTNPTNEKDKIYAELCCESSSLLVAGASAGRRTSQLPLPGGEHNRPVCGDGPISCTTS